MKIKLMAFLCVCTMVISLLSPIAVRAEGTVSDDAKANVLNQLKLLQGNGQDYNLNGSLKRSEAVTFIVRVLNKESEVLANPTKYNTTGFADVKSKDWFAAYVGYCVQEKIVNGYPDKTFKPNELISEKAFVKMLLGAIGHKADEDFTWDSVYSYAAGINLLDSSYASITQDNLQYKRSGAIAALYASLQLKNKQTQLTLLDLLDPTHVLAPELAPTPTPTPTPIPDALISAISTVQAASPSKVTIQFNETIQTVNPTDITIYEVGNPESKLTLTIESQTTNQLVLNTSNQKANQDYTIEIKNVKDTDNHLTALLNSTFKGYVIQEIKSDFFKISKIETVSKFMLNVYFTQPINGNLEFSQYYEIFKDGALLLKGNYDNLSVKQLNSSNNVISLLLKKDVISASGTYTIKISGDVTSLYDVKLNDGHGDSMQFSPNSAEIPSLSLVNVLALNDNTLQISFNKELDLGSAEQVTNYSLKDTNNVPVGIIRTLVSGEGNAKSKVVLLRIAGAFAKNLNYELVIKNIRDNNNQFTLPDSKYGFVGKTIPVHTDLVIVNVTPEDNGTLNVYFDRKLNSSSLKELGLYTLISNSDSAFSGSIQSIYYTPEEPFKVKLYLNAGGDLLSPGASYKLLIQSGMLDELDDSSIAIVEKTFSGNGNGNVKPFITDAKIIGKDTILFHTNKEIDMTGQNVSTVNYTLEYKVGDTTTTKTISNVNYINAKTGVFKVDNLDMARNNYTIRISSLTDFSNQYTRTSSDSNTIVGVTVGR